jgi:hypothetical protein
LLPPPGAVARVQLVREIASWRDVDEIEEFGNAAAGRLESSFVSPTEA